MFVIRQPVLLLEHEADFGINLQNLSVLHRIQTMQTVLHSSKPLSRSNIAISHIKKDIHHHLIPVFSRSQKHYDHLCIAHCVFKILSKQQPLFTITNPAINHTPIVNSTHPYLTTPSLQRTNHYIRTTQNVQPTKSQLLHPPPRTPPTNPQNSLQKRNHTRYREASSTRPRPRCPC